MASNLVVRLRIQLGNDWDVRSPIGFHRWAPTGDDHAFTVEKDGLAIKVWFDAECIDVIGEIAPGDVEKWVNLRVGTVCLDIAVPGVDDGLVEFIYEERNRLREPLSEDEKTDEYKELAAAYEELGKRVMAAVRDIVDRLTTYFRVYRGQYWLDPVPEELDYHSIWIRKARVKSDYHDWHRWCPPPHEVRIVARMESEWRFLPSDHWPAVVAFVRSGGKADFTLELLSHAERLMSEGYRRASLIEAVAALEIALNRFSQTPDLAKLEAELGDAAVRRLRLDALPQLIEKFGLRGSMRFLIPVLFSEKILNHLTLAVCQEAIDVRGNVVHGGQRDVQQPKLLAYVNAIRATRAALDDFTARE
jgi:hypothetical protein